MEPPQLSDLILLRARVEALVKTLRAGRRRGRRSGDRLIQTASATVVVATALVLLRGAPAHVPAVAHLAASQVSMRSWEIATPSPTKSPVATPRPPPPRPAPVFADAPMPRAAGIDTAIRTAHSLVGRPYRWGASGPDAFDCSGFTSFVWRTAGLTLPHNSAAQFASLPQVPVDSLEPGDLIFSGSGGITHAGLYVGDGRMIHSPETGRSVEIEVLRRDLVGAARPALLLPQS